MFDLAVFHPQIVHFVVALLIAGVALRILSLLGKWPWMHPAAAALVIAGAAATVAAVRSGDDAHGVAERIPGARAAVVEHEEWGQRTRNFFLIVAALEAAALLLAEKRRRLFRFATAALGAGGLFLVYEAGEHGGELVYSYAGGVGTRSGDPQDIRRLLLAGLYHQAMQDRRDGKSADAHQLIAEMARRFPEEGAVRRLAVESQWRDVGDLTAARTAVEALIAAGGDEPQLRSVNLLKVDILAAMGHRDSARAILEPIATQTQSERLLAKLDSLR
jgi:uncharacterized membrane protein